MLLKTYFSWSHKLPNAKFIFKNSRIKAYFDALVYELLCFQAIPPFCNVCTVWLYTLSQSITEQNQLGSHIVIHWRSYALGFWQNQNISQVKDSDTQIRTMQYFIAEKYPVLLHWWIVYAFSLKPASLHFWAIPNFSTLLSYTQSCHIVEVYPTLKHCWAINCLRTLLNCGRSKYTAVGFRARLSAPNQNRVIRHPIAQWKIDLTNWETDNLNTTCTYMGAKLKPMP